MNTISNADNDNVDANPTKVNQNDSIHHALNIQDKLEANRAQKY